MKKNQHPFNVLGFPRRGGAGEQRDGAAGAPLPSAPLYLCPGLPRRLLIIRRAFETPAPDRILISRNAGWGLLLRQLWDGREGEGEGERRTPPPPPPFALRAPTGRPHGKPSRIHAKRAAPPPPHPHPQAPRAAHTARREGFKAHGEGLPELRSRRRPKQCGWCRVVPLQVPARLIRRQKKGLRFKQSSYFIYLLTVAAQSPPARCESKHAVLKTNRRGLSGSILPPALLCSRLWEGKTRELTARGSHERHAGGRAGSSPPCSSSGCSHTPTQCPPHRGSAHPSCPPVDTPHQRLVLDTLKGPTAAIPALKDASRRTRSRERAEGRRDFI